MRAVAVTKTAVVPKATAVRNDGVAVSGRRTATSRLMLDRARSVTFDPLILMHPRCGFFTCLVTCHINEQKGGCMTSDCVVSFTVIVSCQIRCDISDGEVLSRCHH